VTRVALCVLFIVCFAGRARAAEDLEACLAAHEAGQSEQQKQSLLSARDNFRTCSGDPCPDVVQKDCRARLADTEKQIPTLVLRIRNGTDVQISIDGGARTASSGEPIALDPGKHRVQAWDASGKELSRDIELDTGTRRELVLDFGPPRAAPASRPSTRAKSGPSPVGYLLGGVAVVGVLGFTGFALSGRSKETKLEACKPKCDDPNVYDDMKRDYLFADVSLGIALAAGVGAYLVLSSKPSEPGVSTIGVKPTEHGGSLLVGAHF
jgi:hypothetical protein